MKLITVVDEFIEDGIWYCHGDKYDGIEINPYQFEARYQYTWYYGWDIASGCIWNLSGVKLKLLTDQGIE